MTKQEAEDRLELIVRSGRKAAANLGLSSDGVEALIRHDLSIVKNGAGEEYIILIDVDMIVTRGIAMGLPKTHVKTDIARYEHLIQLSDRHLAGQHKDEVVT